MRPFVLERAEDVTGVSGTGVVAEGIEFSDGTVALRWTSEWPTSVVFHERGIESVEAVHGHAGKTRIVYRELRPEWLADADEAVWSNCSVDGQRQTWREEYERERARCSALNEWAVLVSDLDRNPNGRHEGDADGGEPSGVSHGNPIFGEGDTIGYTLTGEPIVMPARKDRHRREAWRGSK